MIQNELYVHNNIFFSQAQKYMYILLDYVLNENLPLFCVHRILSSFHEKRKYVNIIWSKTTLEHILPLIL